MIPTNFLIGPDGKILEKNLRRKLLEHKITELLEKKHVKVDLKSDKME